jgi:uncharacterized protein (TIGR03083 family)
MGVAPPELHRDRDRGRSNRCTAADPGTRCDHGAMEVGQYVEAVRDSGDRLGRAAVAAGLGAAVPTCTDWQVRDLLGHVGGVHRWATSYVLTGREGPTTEEEDAEFFVQVPDDELVGWYREGHGRLVSALSSAEPAMSCWTFLPAPSPLAFWARRQAHETTIHGVDAEASAGLVSEFSSELAVDGLDELLNGFFARAGGRLVADPPISLGVRPRESEIGWTVHIGPDGRTVSAGGSEADCVITGSAHDLYLFLWNRGQAETAITVDGDARVLDHWRTHAVISWG